VKSFHFAFFFKKLIVHLRTKIIIIKMQIASVSELKKELSNRPPKELLELCLTLSKFKKENKELLTYLLYERDDEEGFIRGIKLEVDELFENVNRKNYFFIKKGVRKILRTIKKYIRYSKRKDTEVELLIYFCKKMRAFNPTMTRSRVLVNIYKKQVEMIEKKLVKLEEDLQYDFGLELEKLKK